MKRKERRAKMKTNYRVIEIDKNAIASYNAIHNTNFEVQTYSFPCQELSINKCKEKIRGKTMKEINMKGEYE
jgi:site-specific DNA-cytosine methylase